MPNVANRSYPTGEQEVEGSNGQYAAGRPSDGKFTGGNAQAN